MLKITVDPGAGEVQLKLEGDVSGTWVRELEECWRTTRASFAGKAACIDLTGVTRVDDAGRYLLALIHETGARMVSSGVAMEDLLHSISRDWPAKRVDGPGWTAIPSPRSPRP